FRRPHLRSRAAMQTSACRSASTAGVACMYPATGRSPWDSTPSTTSCSIVSRRPPRSRRDARSTRRERCAGGHRLADRRRDPQRSLDVSAYEAVVSRHSRRRQVSKPRSQNAPLPSDDAWPCIMLRLLIAVAIGACASPAFADLWAYVDPQGHSHVTNRQVDARYTLFFKGATTLDAPDAPPDARTIDALAGTRLYEQATDPARVHRFSPLIEANAHAAGLDPALVRAVVAVESAFDPRAVSAKGAVGLMQILPDTGERYGVRADAKRRTSDKLLDPATNLRV